MVYTAYCDGASSKNGDGGIGCLLFDADNQVKIFSKYYPNTTNNRMELTSAIEVLKMVKKCDEVNLFSDSQYIVKPFTEGWIIDWLNRDLEDVKNADLWVLLLEEYTRLNKKVNFNWVKGHSNNLFNNIVDKLAFKAKQND
jgi:ribonuclease HI